MYKHYYKCGKEACEKNIRINGENINTHIETFGNKRFKRIECMQGTEIQL